jgi:hypothetical protein
MGEPVDFDLLLEGTVMIALSVYMVEMVNASVETLEEFTKPDEVKKKGRSNNKNNINNDTEQDGEGAGMPFDLMEEMQKMLDELNLTSTPAAANLATTPADYKQQKDVYSMKEEDDGSVNELLEQMASLAGSSQTNEDGDPYANASKPKDFNEALNDTVNRIKNSDEKVKSQLSKNESMVDDQMLEQMMKQLGQLDGNGGGSFEGMMKEMVKQHLGKDVLYEPLLELASKVSLTPAGLLDNLLIVICVYVSSIQSGWKIIRERCQRRNLESIECNCSTVMRLSKSTTRRPMNLTKSPI